MSTKTSHSKGFTLIELIVTLVLAGLVGALIMPFFYAGIFESRTAMDRVSNNRELQAMLENAMTYYFNSNDYYKFSDPGDYQPLNDEQFANGTDGPMVEFANWLNTNWNQLNSTSTIDSLTAQYPFEPTSNGTTGPSPYASDNRVVRVNVTHTTGLEYVLYIGQAVEK